MAKVNDETQKRTRCALLLAVGLFSLFNFACSSWSRQDWLDETYKPGTTRASGEIVNALQTNEWIHSIMLKPKEINGIPDGAVAALGGEGASRAVGYDVYDVRLLTGNRQQRRFVSRCDLVFFDQSELVVGAYRRLGPCER